MRILILLTCFIFLSLPIFAEYKPVPAALSKQYKTEIEQLINNEYSKTRQDINNIFDDANKSYIKTLKR